MSYKLGTKLSAFYAAKDPQSGEYLEASGWAYDAYDPWMIRRANYWTGIRRLGSNRRSAQQFLDRVGEYWQREIDQEILRKSDSRYQSPGMQAAIDKSLVQLRGYLARQPELTLIRVSTTVIEEPV